MLRNKLTTAFWKGFMNKWGGGWGGGLRISDHNSLGYVKHICLALLCIKLHFVFTPNLNYDIESYLFDLKFYLLVVKLFFNVFIQGSSWYS